MNVMVKLVALDSLDGTNKGLIEPSGTVVRSQFIKILVRAMFGAEALNWVTGDFDYWASKNVKKAEEVGLLAKGQYNLDNIDQPISHIKNA